MGMDKENSNEVLLDKIFNFYNTNSIDTIQVEMSGISINIVKNDGAELNKSITNVKERGKSSENLQLEVKEDNNICSPMVGIFYCSSEPGKDSYVNIGDRVRKDDVVGIIEAMKSFNELKADRDGIITEILVSNGQMVEHGQPLFKISQIGG